VAYNDGQPSLMKSASGFGTCLLWGGEYVPRWCRRYRRSKDCGPVAGTGLWNRDCGPVAGTGVWSKDCRPIETPSISSQFLFHLSCFPFYGFLLLVLSIFWCCTLLFIVICRLLLHVLRPIKWHGYFSSVGLLLRLHVVVRSSQTAQSGGAFDQWASKRQNTFPFNNQPDVLTYLLTYLLTYSMEQSPSWEANWFCS
jgi:hypothetical protein